MNAFFASFRASTDYKRMVQSISKRGSIFTESVATCDVYSAYLHNFDLPPLRAGFRTAVESLPGCSPNTGDYGGNTGDYSVALNDAAKEAYYRLIDSYGTHYVTRMDMGGSFGIRQEFTQDEYAKLKATGLDVNVALSASFMDIIGGGFGTKVNKSDNEQNTHSSKSMSREVFSVGGHPSPDGNPETWMKNSVEEPMPIRYRLEEITQLFTANNFPSDKSIECKRQHMLTVLQGYCDKLLAEGQVSSCNGTAEASERDVPETKLDVKSILDYEKVWSYNRDRLLRKRPVSLYMPNLEDNVAAIGAIQIQSNDIPPPMTMAVKLPAPDTLIQPATGWEKLWKDKGSGAKTDVQIFRPICKEGYHSISDFPVPNYDDKVTPDQRHRILPCIASTCLETCFPRKGWTSKTTWSKTEASFWTYNGGVQQLGSNELLGGAQEAGGFFRVEMGHSINHPANQGLYKCLQAKCISSFVN